MPTLLLATDADEVFEEIEAALADAETTVERVGAGAEVLAAVEDLEPDLVILDLQIGNMGGMATCMNLRLEESSGRIEPVTILMLLDRPADVFLAKRSDADGWLVKPIDAFRTRQAADALLEGLTYTEGTEAGVGN